MRLNCDVVVATEASANLVRGLGAERSCPNRRKRLLGLVSKSLWTVTAVMKLKDLLFRRKAMTNLDGVLKSQNITLPTKVHIVKAMVFPVVMCRCESWTVKKAQC